MQVPTRDTADLAATEAWMTTELADEHRDRPHWQAARASVEAALRGSGDPETAWRAFEDALQTDEEESGTTS